MVVVVAVASFLIIWFCVSMKEKTGRPFVGESIFALIVLLVAGAVAVIAGIVLFSAFAVVGGPVLVLALIAYAVVRSRRTSPGKTR